ncbi:MAG: cysteine desulfurase / selenocysteine lyase [Myxococcales bacterium]|nr:cysteine desulfurase / selenocysteine lyase [Myxococcales bacterium]
MSTRDESFEPPAAALPGELRPHQGQLPNPGDTMSTPSAAASTPGVALAGARVPGAPTLPDFDPVSMTSLIGQMANEMFAAPTMGDLPTPTTSAPTTLSAPSAPVSVPSAPVSVPSAAAPFGSPIDFGGIALMSDPFGGAMLSAPLLDFPPDEGERKSTEVGDRTSLTRTAEPVISVDAYEIVPVSSDPAFGSLGDASTRQDRSGPLDPHALKREFPILQETVNGRPLVWLDNAATTQKPRAVIDRLSYFYEHENSNIHRAAHTLAARATEAYESARESVRRFVNAPSTRDVVFVRGATEAINLVAQSWGRRNVQAGDEIVITVLEHHANIVPWQMLCSEKGARLRVAPVDNHGQVILEEYEKLLNPKTRLVSFTQVSNALGTITPAKEMVDMAHRHGARVLVDGAQAVSHMRVDVQDLDCDFYVFSGHKVFAPTGIGALYGRSELLEAMPPWQGGGNMIQDVTFEKTTYQPPPSRFEAGTGNIADAVGLGAAVDWLTRLGLERVERYEHELLVYATDRLKTVPGLTIIGTAPAKAGVISFVLAGQKTEEVGGMLDRDGIAVRSGHHCAQPILRRFGLEASVRASLAPYNTFEDIDTLVAALRRIQAGRATPR